MNPFGMRPIHSLDHLIKPIKDGSALQFIDQPDREIKCYTAAQAALGKGVPLYENGSVYHVKKKDLAEALGLNASTVTDDELNTEFIWHLIQIASTSYSMDSAALNGTKEILIGDYYRSIGEFEEGRRWTEIGLAKRFKPPDLTEDDLKKHTRLSLLGSPRSAQTLFDYYQKEMEINPFDESIKIKRRQALINAAQLELPDALLTLYYDAFDANSASYDKDFFQILVDIAIKKAETTDPEAKNQPGFDIYAIGMLFADRPFTEDIASHCFKVAIEKKFYSGYLGLAKIFNNPEDKVRHICLATQHGVTDGLSDLNKIAQDGKMKFILKIFLALLSSSGSLSPLAISWLHTNASNNPELFFGTSATLDMIAQKDKNIGSALLKELIKDPKMFSELLIVPLQSIISAEDFEAGCNISLMKSSDADEADRIITIFRNRSRDFYPDRNQRLLAQIPIDISAAIKFDRFIPNVLNHASNGNPKAIEVIKELATVNRPAALLALPKIELIETLSKVDLATFRTDAVDAALEKYILDTLKPELALIALYLSSPNERLPRLKENCVGLELLEKIATLSSLPIHSRLYDYQAMLNRCIQLLKDSPNDFLKIKISQFILRDFATFKNLCQTDDTLKFLNLVIKISELSSDILEFVNHQFLSMHIQKDHLEEFERQAISKARATAQERKVSIDYLKAKANDPKYYNLYNDEVLYSARLHSEQLDELFEIAFQGNREAQALLEELASKGTEKDQERYLRYAFKKAFIETDYETLVKERGDLTKRPLQSRIFADYESLINIYHGRGNPYDPVDARPSEISQKAELIIIMAAGKNSHYMQRLIEFSLKGNRVALDALKEYASKEDSTAMEALVRYVYKKTFAEGRMDVIKSSAYDHAVELYFACEASTSLADYEIFNYILPPEYRLSWFAELKEPIIFHSNQCNEFETALQNPEIRKIAVEGIRAALEKNLPPRLLKQIALLTQNFQAELGLHDEHPAFQRSIEILASFEAGGDKNPLKIFTMLQQLKKEPSTYSPPRLSVEGKEVTFNLGMIQALASGINIPRSALHADVTWDKWKALIQQIEDKKEVPAVAEAINERTTGGWEVLLNTCLKDDAFFKSRIEYQGEHVPLNTSQLNAILHKIFNLSDEGSPLSPKEERLIIFAESVKNCTGGKFEGVSLFYNDGLEPQDKFNLEISNESDPAKSKAKSVLVDQYQNLLAICFSGDNPIMHELLEEEGQIFQVAHQSIYLKNLVAHIVGFQHEMHFDTYTGTLYESLINRSRDEVIEIFFKHFTPQTLVDHLHAWMIRDSEVAGRKNWDKIFSLVVPGEDDMIWDPDTDMPIAPTKIYARKILEEAGYLIGGENESNRNET